MLMLFRPISPWTEARLQTTWSSADSSVSPRRARRISPSPGVAEVRSVDRAELLARQASTTPAAASWTAPGSLDTTMPGTSSTDNSLEQPSTNNSLDCSWVAGHRHVAETAVAGDGDRPGRRGGRACAVQRGIEPGEQSARAVRHRDNHAPRHGAPAAGGLSAADNSNRPAGRRHPSSTSR